MTVTVETLAIGNINGPRVYILVHRVGTHLSIEEMPDDVTNERQARMYAARRWNVPECDVKFKPVQIIELAEDES